MFDRIRLEKHPSFTPKFTINLRVKWPVFYIPYLYASLQLYVFPVIPLCNNLNSKYVLYILSTKLRNRQMLHTAPISPCYVRIKQCIYNEKVILRSVVTLNPHWFKHHLLEALISYSMCFGNSHRNNLSVKRNHCSPVIIYIQHIVLFW